VSVTQITAGTTVNVIPEKAELRGSIRATSEGTRRDVLESLVRIGEGVAAAHEMRATVEIEERYPVTVNDEASADWVLSVAEEAFGAERVIRYHRPMMGSEDFSYVLRQVPGAVAFLGSCPPGMDPRRAPVNHSNRMIADEAAMTTGIEMYARVALHALT
jgi:hippurate hydrolase